MREIVSILLQNLTVRREIVILLITVINFLEVSL